MRTLIDYLGPNLDILSIGLNPSTISKSAHEKLLRESKIGFTDVVKRHSSMGKDLRASDYKLWSPKLKELILENRPRICWFHGKVAFLKYMTYAENKKLTIEWGLQSLSIGGSEVFVTPNPSPANAAYSLDAITDWYKELSKFKDNI